MFECNGGYFGVWALILGALGFSTHGSLEGTCLA